MAQLIDDRTPLVAAVLAGDRDAAEAEVARDPQQLACMSTVTFFPIRRQTGETCGDYGGMTKKGKPCKRPTYVRGGMLEEDPSRIGLIDTLEWAMEQVERRLCKDHLHSPAATQWREDIIAAAGTVKPLALSMNRTWRQMTPLMCAMWQRDWPLALWLLQATPLNYVDMQTPAGLSAVHLAAITGNDDVLRAVMCRSPGISAFGLFSARTPRTYPRHPLILCVVEGLHMAVKTMIEVMTQQKALGCEQWPASVKRCALTIYETMPPQPYDSHRVTQVVRGWIFRRQWNPTVRNLHVVNFAGVGWDLVFSGAVPPVPHIGWHSELSCCGLYTVTDPEGVAQECGRCISEACRWTVRVTDAPEEGSYFVECSVSGILLTMNGSQPQHAVHSNFLRTMKLNTSRPQRNLLARNGQPGRFGRAWCVMMETAVFPMGGVLSGSVLKSLGVDQFEWVLHDPTSHPHVCRYLRNMILHGPTLEVDRSKLTAAIRCPVLNMCEPFGLWPNTTTLLDTLCHRMNRDALRQSSGWSIVLHRLAVMYSALQGHHDNAIDWDAAVLHLDCPLELTVLATYPNDGKNVSVGRQLFKTHRPLWERAFRAVAYGPNTSTSPYWLTAWFKTARWTMLLASAREGPLPQLPEAIVMHIMSFVQHWTIVQDRIVLRYH